MFNKRVRLIVPLVGLCLVVTGSAASAEPPNGVPIQGEFVSTFQFIPNPDGSFSAPVDGSGQLAHLGATIIDIEQTVVFQPDGTAVTQSTSVYTSANGDELWMAGSGAGEMTPDGVVRFTGTDTIVGGTGRFADATGWADYEGFANLATLEGGFTITGGGIAY